MSYIGAEVLSDKSIKIEAVMLLFNLLLPKSLTKKCPFSR